jgi:hypothetical protein
MSSALSITQAVNPPRAVFLDYPLGHTAGKPHDKADQRRIMIDTLRALESIQSPGTVVSLNNTWSSDHSWKDTVMRPRGDSNSPHNDDRVERFPDPQYQTEQDALLADPACPTCVFLDDS